MKSNIQKAIQDYKKQLSSINKNSALGKQIRLHIIKLEESLKEEKRECVPITSANLKKKFEIKKYEYIEEMYCLNFPKILHLYWDLSVFSYLNLLTIESFNRYHTGWEIIVHVPKEQNTKINWSSFEHKIRLTGKNYFERLKEYKNVTIKEIELNVDFLKNASEIVKSDYLRYQLLYTYGGVWSDFDIIYIDNIEKVLQYNAQHCKWETPCSNLVFRCTIDNIKYYPIGFFIAEKNSLLFKYILEQCEKYYDENAYQTIGANMWNVLFDNEENLYKIDANVKILDNKFYLPLQCDRFDDIFLKNNYFEFSNETVGIHWFNGSNQSKHYQNELDSRLKDFTPKVFIDHYVYKYLKHRNILLFSESSYPGGGGEEFMMDVAKFFHKKSYNVYWINFHDWGKAKYNKQENIEQDFFTQIKLPRDVQDITNFDFLKTFISKMNIQYIFTQGEGHKLFCDVGNVLNIPTISIWCFWEESIHINWDYGLQNIETNLEHHKKTDTFLYMKENLDYFYFASKFVKSIIEKKYNITLSDDHVLPTFPNNERFRIENNSGFHKEYITLFDVHTLKGGKIFAELIEKNPTKNFLGIKTEGEDAGPNAIKEAMKKVSNQNSKNILLMERENNVKKIYEKTKIVLMPTYLDETFGRVVYESFTNRIPVIFGNRGNLKYIEGEHILKVDMDDINVVQTIHELIQKLFQDENYYNLVVNSQTLYVNQVKDEFNLQRLEDQFLEIENEYEKNIAIFSPWCDQGLGIQSRIYKHLLEKMGYNVFIFSTKPYIKTNFDNLIKNQKEWKTNKIYYSPNRRLDVKTLELDLFVRNYKIKKMIIPEIRYQKVFDICNYLKKLGVKTYAIPNIDCSKRDEIIKYKEFFKVGLNNNFCDKILKDNGHFYSEYLGFHYTIPPCIPFEEKQILVSDKVKVLHLSGLNGMDKKNTYEIINICDHIYQKNQNFELYIVIQGNFKQQDEKFNKPFIKLRSEHLSYQQILEIYNQCHVSIHLSKNEGLGLGFFESCYTHTPVITLNAPPYNEIIFENKNGWLIDSFTQKEQFYHDAELVVEQNNFETNCAIDKILSILENTDNINNVIKTTKKTIDTYYSYEQFEKNIKQFLF